MCHVLLRTTSAFVYGYTKFLTMNYEHTKVSLYQYIICYTAVDPGVLSLLVSSCSARMLGVLFQIADKLSVARPGSGAVSCDATFGVETLKDAGLWIAGLATTF